MSSEAITQNDLREILSRTVGSVPSEYKKLLWTNPSPTANFGTQTVISNIDLTIYDEIEIYYSANTGYPDCDHIVRQPIGTNSYIFGTSNWLTAKSVSITTSAIGFGDSLRYSYGGNGTVDNAQLIPQKIYGIKYERVSIPQEGVPSVHIVKKSLTPTAQAGKASWTVSISDVVPSGATVQSVIISRLPNPNWIYANVYSYTNAQVVIPYNNTYSASITEPLELGILYTL